MRKRVINHFRSGKNERQDRSTESAAALASTAEHDSFQVQAPASTRGRWERAYGLFQVRQPEVAASLRDAWASAEGMEAKSFFDPQTARDLVQQKTALHDANLLEVKCAGKSFKIREEAEKVVKFILWSKDIVASALTTQPYAALAWSGVLLILPLVLNASEQNGAMTSGLATVTDMLQLYRAREQLYLDDTDTPASPELEILIIELYSYILEYQGQIVYHLSKSSLRRAARGTFMSCPWRQWLADIQTRDDHCTRITHVIDLSRERAYQEKSLDYASKSHDTERALLDEFKAMRDDYRHLTQTEDGDDILELLSSKYQEGKDIHRDRVPGTCQWVLGHHDFQHWLNDKAKSLLWLSAGPGCGKSVIAKALINEGYLEQTGVATRVCYFFFKDGQQGRMEATDAVSAILHQVFISTNPADLASFSYTLKKYAHHGRKLRDMFSVLWGILTEVLRSPDTARLILVIDALDECRLESRQELLQSIVELCHPENGLETVRQFKFLITSRRYDDIEPMFEKLAGYNSYISLDGNDNADKIRDDIDKVVDAEVEETFRKFPPASREIIRDHLKSADNRTYLWLYLTMDVIRSRRSMYSKLSSVETLLNDLPTSLTEIYQKMLEKAPDPVVTLQVLEIILMAAEPLTLDQMNVALAVRTRKGDYEKLADIDTWPQDTFRSVLENLCGLLVQVYHDKVYLIHRTAREFLLSRPVAENGRRAWSVDASQAHYHIFKVCLDWHGVGLVTARSGWYDIPVDSENRRELLMSLRKYVARYWAAHYQEIACRPLVLVQFAHMMCILDTTARFGTTSRFVPDGLKTAAGKGLMDVCSYMLDTEIAAHPEDKDQILVDSLIMAVSCSYTSLTRLLIELGALVNQQGASHNEVDSLDTALRLACTEGDTEIIRLLLEAGADVNLYSEDRTSPLQSSVDRNDLLILTMLLQQDGTNVNAAPDLRPPLLTIASRSWMTDGLLIAKILLDAGADPNLAFPLQEAARNGYLRLVQVLVDAGADVDARDADGATALEVAVKWMEFTSLQSKQRRRAADPLEDVPNPLGVIEYLIPRMSSIESARAYYDQALQVDVPAIESYFEIREGIWYPIPKTKHDDEEQQILITRDLTEVVDKELA